MHESPLPIQGVHLQTDAAGSGEGGGGGSVTFTELLSYTGMYREAYFCQTGAFKRLKTGILRCATVLEK